MTTRRRLGAFQICLFFVLILGMAGLGATAPPAGSESRAERERIPPGPSTPSPLIVPDGGGFVVHPAHGTPAWDPDVGDTENITWALLNARSGATVRLLEGKYYCNTLGVLDIATGRLHVPDFRGALRGAGMGKTVIDTLRSVDLGNPAAPGLSAGFTFRNSPTVFRSSGVVLPFSGSGDIQVSDLTFDITPYSPSDLPDPVSGTAAAVPIELLLNNKSTATLQRLEFIAHEGVGGGMHLTYRDYGGNVTVAIQVPGGSEKTVVNVQGCVFKDVMQGLQVGWSDPDLFSGRLRVENSTFDAFSPFTVSAAGADIDFSFNRITNSTWGAVQVLSNPGFGRSRVQISDNDIVVTNHMGSFVTPEFQLGVGGIVLIDFEKPSMSAVVRGNRVRCEPLDLDPEYGIMAALMDWMTQGTLWLNNVVEGIAWEGIDAGANHDCIYTGNDFTGLTLQPTASWYGGGAYLGAVTLFGTTDSAVLANDFRSSGIPGWGDPTAPAGAVYLSPGTSGNKVLKASKWPSGTNICEQVLDLTDDPATPRYDGANQIVGWDVTCSPPRHR